MYHLSAPKAESKSRQANVNSATPLCGRLHKEPYLTSISIMPRQNVGELTVAPTCVYLPL